MAGPSPWASAPKSARLTVALIIFTLLAVLILLQREGCGDSDSPDACRLTSAAVPRAESVNMVSLFVAGVLTKGVSHFMGSEQLLWLSAL
eukprot:Skav215919  [mRNA]  locus=scaffold226:125353:137670:+ [translate_table: standard]